ncbi:MAG: DUF2817 domain-containing protein [Winogradskyella sp.]|uniref:M14 family zinc carboxypeptidase n=1 Tax=Winogradskyella sp. TaxID=1883156 RepID=UPI000F3EA901|nr:M14 family zinc carboxypeptidase [Winogradskyella sp.]RNC87293.1 MAG: DUF2817 domain-containing protein [Winogradskyella sp.]
MTLQLLSDLYTSCKEQSLFGRYITNSDIEVILDKYNLISQVKVEGFSVENRPIHSIKIGNGKTKILLWSQMHGNESTTTKAIFDLLNAFLTHIDELQQILNTCTLLILPILNPDGAQMYTRVNANKVDLNRDAQDLSQPESKVLRECFNRFQPNYCFNLHGQRTLFGAGNTGNSATLSFLSPSVDSARTVTTTRKVAMAIIGHINKQLQNDLPNAIGRYDDGFNINCVGDTFQSLGSPTVLYEAGHYKDDYNREKTREYVFKALFYGINYIAQGLEIDNYEWYFNSPENKKNFFDIIIRNAKVNSDGDIQDIAIQFKEVLIDDGITFLPIVEKIENLDGFYGHREIDAEGKEVLDENKLPLKVANEIDFVVLNFSKILIKV